MSPTSSSVSAQTQKRPRVLVIAELANPDWISVPLVGWSLWRALQKHIDGHLVTHLRNEENIRKAGEPSERLTILDTTPVERQVYKVVDFLRGKSGGGFTTETAFYTFTYYYFEHLLWQRFGASIRAGEWDVVHRLTPLAPTIPSLIAKRCHDAGVPFVIGPLNGGVPWPKGFDEARLNEREWLTYVREGYRLMPGYRSTRNYASAIVVGSRDTREQIARPYREKTVYMPENAIDPARFGLCVSGPITAPLKVAFVGRFTMYKGADMLLEAAAPLVRAGKVKLDMIGDGAQMESLKAIAKREGLPDDIFAGWIKHERLQERLCQSDVFAFPSIREFGGAVVLEAMSLGLAPVVMNYGGPGELVSPSTGIALPMGNRQQIITRLREALERLAADPEGARAMGQRARERVFRLFTWDAKAAQMLEVYRWVMGQREQPDFGMPLPD